MLIRVVGMCMKNKHLFIGVGLFIVAVLFRFLCLDKSGGLWYDELVSYKEAFQPDVLSVIKYTLKTDVHLPLYPVLLHLWAKMFSFSDLSLRAFSAFFGVLSVIAAYFCGREFNSQKAGLFCAGIFALNSFFIYYSQEVRLYSFLIFLITLLTFWALKLKQQTSFLYIVMFALTAWAVVHTYTIAFLYVVPVFCLLYFVKIREKSTLIPVNSALGLFLLLSLPAFLYVLYNYQNYTEQINGYYCDWSSLFVVLQDLFSPVLVGLLNNPVHYMSALIARFDWHVISLVFMPVVLSIVVIVYAVKRDKSLLLLLLPSCLFLAAEIIAFMTTNFKILPRYVSLAMPNILLSLGVGLSMLPSFKRINIIIPLLLFIVNISYLCFSPHAAFKLPRDGFRAVSELINSQNLSDGDFVVVWNRKEVLDKYVKSDKLVVLSLLKDFAYRSERILGHEKELNKLSLEERKNSLRSYFGSSVPSHNNIALLVFLFQQMKKGQKFIITSNTYFDAFSPEVLADTVNDEEKYGLISYNDLLTIKALITVKEMCLYNLNFIGKYEKDGSVIFVFEK